MMDKGISGLFDKEVDGIGIAKNAVPIVM